MSHTIGQIQEDNQQSTSGSSTASKDSSASVDKSSESVPLLSDADYEFLFNQLLEGIAHGWHDRRIDKFFKRLGDRGKPKAWVAWLERLRVKLVTLPVQSKQQLGTIMIRLGELTQSTPGTKEIGSASNRIGRELLFGNTEDVIWEYVGPDIAPNTTDTPDALSVATEEDISDRLPADFNELGMATNTEEETVESPSSTEVPDEDYSDRLPSEGTAEDLNLEQPISSAEKTNIVTDNTADLEEVTIEDPKRDPFLDRIDAFPENLLPNSNESTVPLSAENAVAEPTALDESNTQDTDTRPQEFEFELDNSITPSETDNLAPENLFEPESDSDPVAIDMDRVMNLIQEDPALAQEISQKLNIDSPPSTPDDAIANNSEEGGEISTASELDKSSVELIEGWFNLGLKQVSAGEFNKAIASWEKALQINPNLSEAWHNRGSALGRLGQYQQAVDSFEKALAIDPENHQAWNDRAHALYQMQKWSEAADSWGNAVKITPANHLFWYSRGCALEQLESWAEAIATYEKCLEIKPDFQPARLRYTNLIADSSHAN